MTRMSQEAVTEYPLALEKNGVVFYAAPNPDVSSLMLALLSHGNDVTGSTIHCQYIGSALAKLLAHARPGRVLADVASEPAVAILASEGIALEPAHVVPRFNEAQTTSSAVLDSFSQRFATPGAFFDELRGRMLSAIDGTEAPSDLRLLNPSARAVREGSGGT